MSIYDEIYKSPNYGYPKGSSGRHGHKPMAVGVHIGGALWPSNYSWIMNPNANASYNCYIKLDGTIVSFVPEDSPAYSHGMINQATWPLLKSGVNPNIYTLSISREGSNQNTWTDAQMQSTVKVLKYWSKKYDIPLKRPYIFGHFEIDSAGRWYCPGRPFFDALIAAIEKADDEEVDDSIYRVISGSFSSLENAEKHALGLTKLSPSFKPLIVYNDVNGQLLYRVIAAQHSSSTDAGLVNKWLRDRGITSFIVAINPDHEDLPFPLPPEKPVEVVPPKEKQDDNNLVVDTLKKIVQMILDLISYLTGGENK